MLPKKKWSVMGRYVRTVAETNYIIQYTNKSVQFKVFKRSTYQTDRDTLIFKNLQRSGDWEGHLTPRL